MSDSTPHIHTLFKSDLVRVFDYRCTGRDGRDEIPQGHEIVLSRSGAFQRRDTHGTFLADPNHILFYNKGEPYDISHPVGGGDAVTVFVFAPSLLIEMIRIYHPDIENKPSKPFHRSHIAFPTQLQILQYKLIRPREHDNALEMEEEIVTRAGEIVHALYQDRPAQGNNPSSRTLSAHLEQTQAVKTFLNAHVRSPLQIERISSAVHLSPYHLCRIFKCYTGMTLHQYVKRLRLFNAAEQMLEHPTSRLDLLALEFGFSNHGNFTTVFRQTFGVNPSDFRSAQFRRMSKNLKA